MTATVVLLTSCVLLLTFSPTLITSQMWNLPFASSSSLRTMFRNPGMLSSDPLSRGPAVIHVTRGVVGVRNQLSPMQQEIRQRQQQLAQLQQQNAQHSMRGRTQPSGQFDRSPDAVPPTFAQTPDVQQFNPNDLRGQDNMAFQRDFQQQLPRQVQRKQMSEAGFQYEGPQSVDYKQQLQRDQQPPYPRRKISEEPQPQQLPFSQYSDTFAHRVHSNRVGASDQQVLTEANSYLNGPEPAGHPNLRQRQHQSFQSREDTVGINVVVNPSKQAFEQGNQQLQQNILTSPYQGVSASQTNFVAPPIPGQQVGIMHSGQVQGQAVPTYQAVPGSPGIVYQAHPNQVMAQPPFPASGPNVQPNVPQNFVASPGQQQQTHLFTQPQPGQQPQYSAIPGVPSGPFPNVPQSGGAGGSMAQGVPAYSMANPMAMYSMNPGGMGMPMQPTGMGMPMSSGGPGMPFSNPMFGMPMGGFPFWMDMESPDSPDPVQPAAPAPAPAAAPASPTLTSQPVNTAPQVPQTAAAQPVSTLPQAPVSGVVALPTPLVSDGAASSAAVPVQTGSGSGAGHSPAITVPAPVVASGTSVAVQGSAAPGTLPSGPASGPVHPSDGAAAAAASAAGVGPVASNLVQVPQPQAAVISPDAASHTDTVASEASKIDVNASTSNLQQTTEPPTSTTTEEYEVEEYEYEDGTTTSATTTTSIKITTTPPPTSKPMLAISGLVKADFGRNTPNSVNQGAHVGGSHGVTAAPVFIYFLPKYGNSSGHDVASPVLVNLARVGQDLMPLLNIGDLFKGLLLMKNQQQLQQKQHIKATSAIGTTVTPPSQVLSALANVLSAAAIKRPSDVVMETPIPVMAAPTGVVSDVYKSHRSPSSSEIASTSVTVPGTTGSYPKEWQNHFDYFFKLYYSLGGTSPQPPTAMM